MKKICSLMLALVMIVAVFAVISIPTSAAVDGEWSVYTAKSQYLDDFTGLPRNIPGYKYVDGVGLQTISPSAEDRAGTTPYVTLQTTNVVNIRNGVYLQVRVDDFSYDASDAWFSFHIWDQQNVEPGKQGDDHGYGVETTIRVKTGKQSNETNADNKNLWAGALDSLQWFSDVEAGVRVLHGNDSTTQSETQDKGADDGKIYDANFNNFDENGKPIMTLEIKWNPDKNMCEVFINGAPAPSDFNQKVDDHFKSKDYMAYVGFSMQNNVTGGVADATILAFGEKEEDASAPIGDDSREPEVMTFDYADIEDASTISKGEPAIILNGSADESNSTGKPSAYNGNLISVNDEGFVQIKANNDGSATATFRVKDDVSFDAKDFPIVVVITKNFCKCEYKIDETTFEEIPECLCSERISTMAMAGDVVTDDPNENFWSKKNDATGEGDKYIENYLDEDGNSYLYFMTDWSDTELLHRIGQGAAMEGRIHGVRVDISGVNVIDAGRDTFEICQIAFFKTEAEARAYAKDYISALADVEIPDDGSGNDDETEEDTEDNTEPVTEPTTEPTTEPVTEPTTEPVTEPTTEPATEPEKETEAKTEANKKPAEKETEKNDDDKTVNVNVNAGCGGTVGFGTLAVVALAGAGLLTFRKKKD